MTSTSSENFSQTISGTPLIQHSQNFRIMMSLMRSFMRHLMSLVTFLGVLFDMETGRVIWTTVPEMGDKVRPCVVICSLNEQFFYVPLSTVDYNTLWQVPMKFKGKNAYADLRRCFTGQKPARTKQRVSTDCLNNLLHHLNNRMEALWATFITHGVTVA